jgi:hypothetical protein
MKGWECPTNGHNFILMNDLGLTKEYLCSSCRATAVMTIKPRQSISYSKENSVVAGNCHKGVFDAIC